jgi:hypothetical protein
MAGGQGRGACRGQGEGRGGAGDGWLVAGLGLGELGVVRRRAGERGMGPDRKLRRGVGGRLAWGWVLLAQGKARRWSGKLSSGSRERADAGLGVAAWCGCCAR